MSQMLWSEESGWKPAMMTFPIKKRINTEFFIDKRAALYIQKGYRKNKD